MRWRPENPAGERRSPGPEWRKFQRAWARPAMIHTRA
jgi:hypothetical protein